MTRTSHPDAYFRNEGGVIDEMLPVATFEFVNEKSVKKLQLPVLPPHRAAHRRYEP